MRINSCIWGAFVVVVILFALAHSHGSPAAVEMAKAYSQDMGNKNNVEGFEIIAAAALPPEARTTLKLIKQGGPLPYPKDGTIFGNRERRLPAHPRGYYKEYTVKTPGSRNRGARRIIAGSNGEFYYTGDHYNSFKLIKE